ncbi:hypothetical protein FGU71_08380 [Erythrobacter insulae]|uniref:Uncharacterized protein n=1 Tax=Erythrobacter insulae TaxID=2584124 RepID=A0A547PCJ9_9SPHN|nr:hypothetical protein [Erythrobacter insulae]TRD11868.1 hypothetical protein FGU71_08380 [Erythrobacter insulae]
MGPPFAFDRAPRYADPMQHELTIERRWALGCTSLKWVSLTGVLLLTACSASDGIDEDGAVFGGISPEATINLVGNEPFWGFQIVPEGMGYTATYTTPENIAGTAAMVTRFEGNNGLGFSGELDDAALQIALTPGECSDTMSDAIYPYTATVSVGDVTLFGCGYTSDEPASVGPNAL